MHLVHCYNYGGNCYYLRSSKEVPTGGIAKLLFEFKKTGQEKYGAGGIGRLYINGSEAGEGSIPQTIKFVYSLDESFDIGRDTGSPVTEEYKADAQFSGTINKVVIDLAGERLVDREAETRVAMDGQECKSKVATHDNDNYIKLYTTNSFSYSLIYYSGNQNNLVSSNEISTSNWSTNQSL